MAYIQKNSPFKQTKDGAKVAEAAGSLAPDIASIRSKMRKDLEKEAADPAEKARLNKVPAKPNSKKKPKNAPGEMVPKKPKDRLSEPARVPMPETPRPNRNGEHAALAAASSMPKMPEARTAHVQSTPIKQTKKGANAAKGK